MLKALMDLGQSLGLRVLFVRAAASQTKEIRAFLSLGFKVEHTFKDRLINSVGDTQDVTEMVLYLKHPQTAL
jgi:L-amino acid N-acyltransferase YncA